MWSVNCCSGSTISIVTNSVNFCNFARASFCPCPCRIAIISNNLLNITLCNIEFFFRQILTHILFFIVDFLVTAREKAITDSNNKILFMSYILNIYNIIKLQQSY